MRLRRQSRCVQKVRRCPSAARRGSCGGWLEELSGLEAISPAWTELLEETKRVLVQPEPAIRALWGRFRRAVSDRWYEYEHLLVYFCSAIFSSQCTQVIV